MLKSLERNSLNVPKNNQCHSVTAKDADASDITKRLDNIDVKKSKEEDTSDNFTFDVNESETIEHYTPPSDGSSLSMGPPPPPPPPTPTKTMSSRPGKESIVRMSPSQISWMKKDLKD